MRSFRNHINEKFSVFPKSQSDIKKLYKSAKIQKKSEFIEKLFNILKKDNKTPLVLNPAEKPNYKTVKISRQFQFMVTDIERRMGIKFSGHNPVAKIPELNLVIAFGDGSRGNRGVNNRGNGFEEILTNDLNYYFDDPTNYEPKFKDFISDFEKITGKFSKYDKKYAEQVGGKNQPRPLTFNGKQPVIGVPNADIGQTVTDVNVTLNNKIYYLSLKMGGTTTFFNSGVRKFLIPEEIQSGSISNKQGLALLSMLGISNTKFCDIFNEYDPSNKERTKSVENVKYDKNILTKFIQSGIGYGYIMVHQNGKHIHTFEVDATTNKKISSPKSVQVYYPTNGNAKRIDVVIETQYLTLKVNIRNKQGGLYPTHIMCDYKWKKLP